MASELIYTLHLQPEPEGGYTVTVPALPGCITWGSGFDEAISMAKEAIELYIETLRELGKPIPDETPSESIETRVQVRLPTES